MNQPISRTVRLGISITAACLTLGLGASRPASAAIAWNRLSTNRLSTNRLAMNKLATNRLSTNRLSTNRLATNMLAADDILSTPGGRELFGFVASCALPAGRMLVAVVDGATYEFPGGVGLAPRWAHRRLRGTERRWISACLLARVNAYGISVEISMRGHHRALATSSEEAADFQVEEGAFYGDVFTADGAPMVEIACMGRDQAAGESGSLVDRDCTEPGDAPGLTKCGFTDAGDCANYSGQPWACSGQPHGAYVGCHDRPGLGEWPEATRFEEVITVYLRK